MRTAFIALLFTLYILLAGQVKVAAQSPSPSPIVINPGKISQTVTNMSEVATNFLEFMRVEVERPLNEYFFLLASALFTLMACAYFVRLFIENEGLEPEMLGRFILRFAICFFVLGNVLVIMNLLQRTGTFIAYGKTVTISPTTVQWKDSWLGKLASTQALAFDDAYEKFMRGLFTVNVNGEPLALTNPGSGNITVLGITKDKGLSLESIVDAAESDKWDPQTQYKMLSLCRLVMEVGALFSLYLSNFAMIFLRLFAPFAAAVAIEKGIANRITWHWAWGVVAISVVLPIITQLLRILCYTAGLMALQSGSTEQLFDWDFGSSTMIQNASSNDVTTIIAVGGFTMLMAGLAMFSSIVIAYQITYGRVFETSAAVLGGWMAGMGAVGASLYSAALGSTINRQAEQTNIQGGYAAETKTLEGQKKAGGYNADANAVASSAQSRSTMFGETERSRTSAEAAIGRAVNTDARTRLEADASFDRTVTESQAKIAGTDVEAQDAANQQRSGVTGIFSDAWKGLTKESKDPKTFVPFDTPTGGDGSGALLSIMQEPMVQESLLSSPVAPVKAKPEPFIGSVTNDYGAPRDYNKDGNYDEKHSGVDIGLPYGTRIGSAEGGEVMFAGWKGGYGKRVEIKHADGRVTSYSHLANIGEGLSEGSQVEKGQFVGRVGNSGTDSRGTHLHYETGEMNKDGKGWSKTNPHETNLRYSVVKAVNPDAAMPTQHGQAIREKVAIEESGRVGAAGTYRDVTKEHSGIFKDKEIRVVTTQRDKDIQISKEAHDTRMTGISEAKELNLKAVDTLYQHGQEAARIKSDEAMKAARLKQLAALVNAGGSTFAQQINRIGDQFKF